MDSKLKNVYIGEMSANDRADYEFWHRQYCLAERLVAMARSSVLPVGVENLPRNLARLREGAERLNWLLGYIDYQI